MKRTAIILVALIFISFLFTSCQKARETEGRKEDLSSQAGMFRGNPQRTGVYNLGDSKLGRINWKFGVDRTIESSLVIYNNVAYVATDFGTFYAINIKAGHEKWKFMPEYLRHISPAIAEGTVFLGASNYLYAVDINTGQEKWKFNAYGTISPPLIVGDLVYFGSENKLFYAVDIKTGKEKWNYRTELYVRTSPAIYGDSIFFSSNDGFLYAMDKHTGTEKWKFKAETATYSPAIADGIIYFTDMNSNLYAVDIKTGKEKWKIKAYCGSFSPTVAEGLVFCYDGAVTWDAVSGIKIHHYIYAVNIESGKEKWRFEADSRISSASVAQGVLYFGTEGGNLYAIDLKTGQKWKYKNKLEGRIDSPPAIAYGSVFVGTSYGGPYLYAIPIEDIKQYPIDQTTKGENNITVNIKPTVIQSAGLTVEEYRLWKGDKITDLEGIDLPEVILKNREKWRRESSYYDDVKLHLECVENTEKKLIYASLDVSKNSCKIVYKGKVVDEVIIVDYPFDDAVKSLHAYKGHWFLEYMKAQIKGKEVVDYNGTVIVDGVNLNEKLGYKEVFNYMLINDKPFYLFADNDGETKMAYDGQTLPVSYNKVVHYACCSESAFNPVTYKDMIGFYSFRESYWYYIEAGVYE